MNAHRRALRVFQNHADDVERARHNTFDDAVRRLVACLAPGTPLGDVAAHLPCVDFAAWYGAQQATVGSMVGSGILSWPEEPDERLAMQVALMRQLAAGQPDVLDFTHDFMWVRNNFDDNVAEFVAQIFRPFARDFLQAAQDNPAFVAGLHGHATGAPNTFEETTDVERNELVQVTDRVMRELYDQETSGRVDPPALVTALDLDESAVARALRYAQKQGWVTLTSVFGRQLAAGVDVTREGMQYAEQLMNVRPNVSPGSQNVYNFHGANARVNHQSVDASVNVVHGDPTATLFKQIEEAVAAGTTDAAQRQEVLTSVRELRDAPDAPTRAQRLGGLLQVGANLMTVLGPFLPQLTQFVTK